jgi:hypothetical protein
MVTIAVTFFFGFVVEKKKKTITSVTFFDGFVVKNGDGNYRHLFKWFCCKEGDGNNVVTFFYASGIVKKVTTIGSRLFFFFPSSLVFYNSLELTINNEMVVFLILKVVMARGRRPKKCGGDLEAHKQNVVSSYVQAVLSLVSLCLPVARLHTKNAPIMH